MSYTEQKALAVEDTFISRVEIGAVITAIAVVYEDKQTDGHDERASYAGQVLRDSRDQARALAHGVAAAPSISNDSTDGAIATRLGVIWNAYAGFSPD